MTDVSIDQLIRMYGLACIELDALRAENAALRVQLGPGPGKDGLPIHEMGSGIIVPTANSPSPLNRAHPNPGGAH